MIAAASLVLLLAPGVLAEGASDAPAAEAPHRDAFADGRRRMDAPVPPPPDRLVAATPALAGRELGTPTTLYVNFDGVELRECNPSNSHENCHWYNLEDPIPASTWKTSAAPTARTCACARGRSSRTAASC